MEKDNTKAFELSRAIEQDKGTSQRNLALQIGISLGAVNYCLKALIAKGDVKVKDFQKSESKNGYIYILTPKGVQKSAALLSIF